MDAQRPLKPHGQPKVKVNTSNTDYDYGNFIILALASPSFYAKGTRIRTVNCRNLFQNNDNYDYNCDSNGGRLGKSKRVRRVEDGIAVASVVSPYFGKKENVMAKGMEESRRRWFGNGVVEEKEVGIVGKEENVVTKGERSKFRGEKRSRYHEVVDEFIGREKDDEGENVMTKGRRNECRRGKESRCETESGVVGDEILGNDVVVMGEKDDGKRNVMYKGKRSKRRRGKGWCREAESGAGVDELLCNIHLTREMGEEVFVLEKRGSDGNSCGIGGSEEHVSKRNLLTGSPVDFQQQKKRKRNVRCDNDMRVVSPYFFKEAGGKLHSGMLEKEKKKRKKKEKKDRSHQELVIDAELQKVVSPYFLREAPDQNGTLETRYLDKKTEKKVKKQRDTWERRSSNECTEMEKEKKVKKQSKDKKRSLDEQLFQEEKDANKVSVLRPPSLVSPCSITKIGNETQRKEGLEKFSISSVLSEYEVAADCRVHSTENEVKDESGKNDIKGDSVIYVEHQEPTAHFRNAKRRKVKPGSLLQSKIEKNQDDLTLLGSQEESGKVTDSTSRTTERKKKKKNKETSLATCCPVIKLENDLDSCSVGSKKENCNPESQGFLQASTIKKVSAYVHKELLKEDHEFSVSSISSERKDVDSEVHRNEINVEDVTGRNYIIEDCVIHGELQGPAPLCSRNVKRKKVKPASLLQSEIEKVWDDVTLDGGQEESDMLIGSNSKKTEKKKKEKKKKKDVSLATPSPAILLADDLDPCSVTSRKEDCKSLEYLQASTIKKVSAYFQKELHKEENEFTVSSASPGRPDADDRGFLSNGINVVVGSGKSSVEGDCVIYGEPHKPTAPCSRNVRKKRVKPVLLVQSKVKKDPDNLNFDGGAEESDMMNGSTNRKTKLTKNKKKAVSSANCYPAIGEECKLDTCSVRSRKEDSTHARLGCLHASTIMKVSPYLLEELQKEKHDYIVDKFEIEHHNKRPPCRTTDSDFEELLSKYAYKCEANGRVCTVNNDGLSLKTNMSAAKKKRCANIYLTAAEKLAEPYRRKAPDNTWRPPRSPFNLLQEKHAHDPWRILVICMLLNMTSGPQVKQVLSALFSLCPNAEAAVSVDVGEIQRLIQSLGLYRKRAAMIQRFSMEYLSDSWTHVTQLHGIGKYAADAYAIFCNGMWNQVTPNDHMLVSYWKFLKYGGLEPR